MLLIYKIPFVYPGLNFSMDAMERLGVTKRLCFIILFARLAWAGRRTVIRWLLKTTPH